MTLLAVGGCRGPPNTAQGMHAAFPNPVLVQQLPPPVSVQQLPPQDTAQNTQATAISPGVPLPKFYGLYAVNRNAFVRLDGSPDWEIQTWPNRENLPADVQFLMFGRQFSMSLQPLDRSIVLERVASVRSEKTAAGTLVLHPLGTVWAAPNLPAYRIGLEFRPVPDHPDMVIAQPDSPLPPGLYSLKLLGEGEVLESRFGVAWSRVAESQYAAEYCVDLYPNGYEPCGAEFAVYDLRAARGTASDNSQSLIIEGKLVNTSPVPALLPALATSLMNAQGQVVQDLPPLSFQGGMLDPGGVYNFRITVSDPVAGATRLRITPTSN